MSFDTKFCLVEHNGTSRVGRRKCMEILEVIPSIFLFRMIEVIERIY